MQPTRFKFEPRGAVAIHPQSFGAFFDVFAMPLQGTGSHQADTSIAYLLEVNGPLEHHVSWCCASYEAILASVKLGCESSAPRILLKLDSPGGVVAGCFETARDMRAACDAAGKELIVYVTGECCSAAYALASVAHRIYVAPSAQVGSVGVISVLQDMTAAAASQGVTVALVTSGARKADGHPMNPITAETLQAVQERVDHLAGAFFQLVSEFRPLSVEQLAGLEACVVTGTDAVSNGLADSACTFDALMSALAAGTEPGDNSEDLTMSQYQKAKANLEKMAAGDDANAKAAKAALALLEQAAVGTDEEPKPEPEKPATEPEPKPGAATPAADQAAATALAALTARVTSLTSALEAKDKAEAARAEADAKTSAISARADISPEVKEWLQGQPLAAVNSFLAKVKPAANQTQAILAGVAGTAVPTVTHGAGNQLPALSAADQLRLDQAFNRGTYEAAATVTADGVLVLSALGAKESK